MRDPSVSPNSALRTFVMRDVLKDYTSGMVVVLARDEDHAWEVFTKVTGKLPSGPQRFLPQICREEAGQWVELTEEFPLAYVRGDD